MRRRFRLVRDSGFPPNALAGRFRHARGMLESSTDPFPSAPVVGNRCANHPELAAVTTCERCGNYACEACQSATAGLCAPCGSMSTATVYHAVPVWRFALFNLLTLGAYTTWWSYKCWAGVKVRDGSSISPAPRALFAAFTNFALLRDMNEYAASRGALGVNLSQGLAAGFFFAGVAGQFPDPWWLASLFAFAFLIPAVQAARELAPAAALVEADRWKTRHTLLALTPIMLLVFFVLVEIAFPSDPAAVY